MKKLLLYAVCILCLIVTQNKVHAQAPSPSHFIYGASPFQDSLWAIDTTNWTIVRRMGPTLPSFTITGINGMAYDPTTYKTYVILKLSAVTGRVLATIDLQTGVCTQIGNLGDNFSSITFREDGQLLGATGNGATVPEALYLIDKNTGTKTLLYAMGNGADGEVILYNRTDDFIYHWSGNGTMVFEKMASSAVAYTPTNIPVTGTPGGETFGSIYVNPNYFIVSNISSNFLRLNPTTGAYSGTIMPLPDDLRGLVMPPSFTISNNSICEGSDTVFIGMGNLQLFDSVSYHWGDATSTSFAATASNASHVYTAPGNYTIHILLNNGVVTDTASSFSIVVNAAPNVTLSGSTTLCPNDTVILTATPGGTSQWYFNGQPVAAATADSITVFTPGIYNLIQTSANGCSDSAATGIQLIGVPNPVITLPATFNACASALLDAGNPGATYLWSNGGTQQMEQFTTSGIYSVLVTDSNNCSASDTTSITINPLPNFSISANTTACDTFTIATNATSGSFLWSDNSTGGSLLVNTTGLYYLTVTDVNGCSNTDSTFITINTSPAVTITSSSATNIVCADDADVLLAGSPAGGAFSGLSVTGNQFDPSAGAGTYIITYSYIDSNGCSGAASLSITVNACVGITENAATVFSILPNPNAGNFTLLLSENNSQVEITDVLGNIVYSSREPNSGNLTVSLENQAAGMYFVRVTNGTKTGVQRLVLSR
jgi:Secretion system C-terminal sorting domain